MKFSKILSLGLSLMMGASILVACGDDSSSSTGFEDADDFFSSKIKVDEQKSVITVIEEYEEDLCVVNGKSYEMKHFEEIQKYDYHYTFVGDTLVFIEGDDEDAYIDVLVGGKKGELYGKWELLSACDYDIETKKIACGDDDSMVQMFYDITEDMMTQWVKFKDGGDTLYEHNDFTKSSVVTEIYNAMFGEGFDFHSFSLYLGDSNEVKEAEKKYGITVKSKTKSSETFEHDGQTFDLEIQREEPQHGAEDVFVTVKSDGKTCEYVQESTYIVDSEYCDAANAEYFSTIPYKNEEFEYVLSYEKRNDEEFVKCIQGLVKAGGKSKVSSSALFKKTDSRKSSRQARLQHFVQKMKRLSR